MFNFHLLPNENCDPEPHHQRKLIVQIPPLKSKGVWAICIRLQIPEKRRNLALFNLAIDSKLGSCDLDSV